MHQFFSKSTLLTFLLLTSTVFLFSSCYKKEDTFAKIYVRDSNNNLVLGVEVKLFGEPTINNRVSNISFTSTTNSAGEAIFNLNEMYKAGQAGVAVLNIEAKLPVTGSPTLTGTGIIKINQEEMNDETVFINN